jgi:hypothetical protein
MQFADWLSVIGFLVAAAGSTLGMLGVFKQAKPFTSISMRDLPAHIVRVFWRYVRGGKAVAYDYVRTAALTGNAAARETPEPATETATTKSATEVPAAIPGAKPATEVTAAPANAGAQQAAATETEEQKAAKAAVEKEKEQLREARESARKAEILDNLVALYCIFSGFVLQFIGAILLLLGTLFAPHPGAGAAPGGG